MAASRPDDPQWLDADQLIEWKSLMVLLTSLPAALEAQLKRDAGLNLFEYHVLVRLGEVEDGRLPMSALAFAAQGSPSRLSHAVRRLERAGWVERIGSSEDGHRVDARLTKQGRTKLVDTAPGHVEHVRNLVIDTLSAESLAALGDAARSIVGAIFPSPGDDPCTEHTICTEGSLDC